MNSLLSITLYRSITALCRLIIISIVVLWLNTGQWLNASVGGITLLLSLLPPYIVRDKWLGCVTSSVVGCLLAAHVALGMYMAFYETSPVYDKIMHFIGSGSIAGLLFLLTRWRCRKAQLKLTQSFLLVLTFCSAVAVGTLWEIFEFSLDLTGLFITQHGLSDTMLDLVANTLGITLVLFLVSIFNRRVARLP